MHLLPFLSTYMLVFSFWQYRLVNASAPPTCDAYFYGRPDLRDCTKALSNIPYARMRGDDETTAPHLFVEPQQMPTPFGYLSNINRPKKILQLPKIWKHNSCRLAFMTLGLSSKPVVVRPVFTSSWKQIIEQSNQLMSCVSFHNPRGGYLGFEMRSGAVAGVLYLYTTGSLFEARMNSYMTNGIPVVPIGLRGSSNTSDIDAFGGAYDVNSLNTSLAGIEPAAPGEFRLLDT